MRAHGKALNQYWKLLYPSRDLNMSTNPFPFTPARQLAQHPETLAPLFSSSSPE